jgi:hypothetical protein
LIQSLDEKTRVNVGLRTRAGTSKKSQAHVEHH